MAAGSTSLASTADAIVPWPTFTFASTEHTAQVLASCPQLPGRPKEGSVVGSSCSSVCWQNMQSHTASALTQSSQHGASACRP